MYCKKLLSVILLPCLLIISVAGYSQDRIITGKVTDSKDGSAMPGVSVSVKGGSSAGTQTNVDGTFKLTVSSSATVLVFSSVGFAPQEISIGGRSSIDIQMVVTNASLAQVLVTGYGTARRKDLTGSIATINSKDFAKGPIISPEQLINAKGLAAPAILPF